MNGLIEFFTVNKKSLEMARVVSKDFTTVKKSYSGGAPPDDHWIKSLMLIHLIVRGSLNLPLFMHHFTFLT